jgi:hypothetical protein
MKTLKQIENEINKQLNKLDRAESPIKYAAERRFVLTYIGGIEFVLDKKERLSISDKTRERLIKAIKEYRNGEKRDIKI